MKEPSTKIWNKMFTCAFIANFFLCVSQFIVNPLVADYAKKVLDASDVLMGVLSGLYFGVAFAARPFSGPIITKMNKKYIMCFAYTMGIIVNIGYALSSTVALFTVSRVLHGIQFAFIGSLNMTLASDSLPPEKLGSGLGLFGVGGATATAIAPSLGLALRSWGEQAFGNISSGYTVVFSVAAACMLVSLIPCAVMPYVHPSKEQLAKLGVWYKNILAKEALLPAVVITFISIAGMSYTAFMVRFAEVKGIDNIGLFFTVYAIALLASRPFCGSLVDKYGTAKVFIPASLIFASSFIIVGLANSLFAVLIGAVVAAVGFGASQPAIQTMCIRSVNPIRRGVASNTNYFGIDFGYFIGPTITGVIISKYGMISTVGNFTFSPLYISMLVPVFLMIIIFAVGLKPFNNRVMKKREEEAAAQWADDHDAALPVSE